MSHQFQQKSVDFWNWLQQKESATITGKIEIADLRARGAGRGVGMAAVL